ncbi:MAG: sigma factor-like helix-turn-helix DNA-binding protein [Parcubacteria group bacterium]|jgi:hypothetical protein
MIASREKQSFPETGMVKKISVSGGDIQSIIIDLLSALGAKQKLIISSRFGLAGSEPKTLESIGKNLNITRERVRQIETDAISQLKKSEKKSELGDILAVVSEVLKEKGGIGYTESLVKSVYKRHFSKDVVSEEEGRLMEIIFLIAGLKRVKSNRELSESWSHESFNAKKFRQIVEWLENILNDSKKVYSISEIEKIFKSSELAEKFPEIDAVQLESFLEVSKKFGRNVFGDWGKAKWPLIKPRGVREKATLVLQKIGKPLHFKEVSRLIEEYKLSLKKVHPQTVHNELIRDKRFVLVGRGTYALREWGYEEGTVKDVIVSLIKGAGGFLAKDSLLRGVLKKRKVKKATIAVNLSDKKVFEKVKGGYKLK